MKDGLYLNNIWVAEVECSLTFQGNDLTKPDTRTASFSNTFTLPDSLVMRDLMHGAEQLDASGPNPYRQLPAKLIAEGETIFYGVAEFISFSAGWKVNLLDSIVSFFDAIADKQLTDLDLSRLDHPWTLERISSLAGSGRGVVYPLIDYGGIEGGIVPYDTITPAVYARDVFGQICAESGYTLIGNWLNDPLFKVLALPFVGSEPKAHSDQWIADRTARVTGSGTTSSIKLESGRPINLILPLNVDNLPLDDFTNGKLKPYKTDRYTYVCPDRMRLKVMVQVMFVSIVRYGAADISLILEKNGQKVAESYYSKGGYYDGLNITETITIEESIDCLPGDELEIRLTGSSKTKIADYAYYFSLLAGETWASFVPDSVVHLGDVWPVAQNLPADISCTDLVLTIAKAMQGTYEIDDFRKTVQLVPLDDVIDNIPNASDWSRNVDESTETEMLVQIEGYGAKNLCKWKDNDDKAFTGYGDGAIVSPVIVNPKEAVLFELPFMACTQSESVVSGYGNPILIKTRSLSGTGTSQTINKNDAVARLILIEPAQIITVQTEIFDTAKDVVKTSVVLTGCWWAKRPAGVRTNHNKFSLSFGPISGMTEQPLIDRYFRALNRVLRRPKMLTVSVYLQPADIATLKLSKPIRLQKVRVGSIEINDNLFYLNKLGPYRSGQTATAVLIAV